MKNLIFLALIYISSISYVFSNNLFQTSIPKGSIIKVFEYPKKENQIELLRLYKSGEYEHLISINQENKSELVKRNLGTYKIISHKIVINEPTSIEFEGQFKSGEYFINNDLYKSKIDFLLNKKKPIIKNKSSNKTFKKPYFIGLNTDEIISNDSIEKVINLKDLVDYIVKDINDDQEKVLAISKFICRSIEYDYDGYYSNKFSHYQNDILAILASKKRVAVCAGYAFIFDSLAKIAKINSKEVSGYTKQNYGDFGKLGGLHAWNIVTINNKKYYIDVTWADENKNIEMKWMFVEPEIMLLSHFPLDISDNLYDINYTKNNFKNREVVLPIIAGAKIKHYPMEGYYRIKSNELILKFKSKVNLNVSWLDSEISEIHYTSEINTRKNKNYSFNSINNITTYLKKDTFYVKIPINKQEIALNIEVSKEYTIKLQVYKGDEKSFYLSKMQEWNEEHVIAFTAGILAAIKTGNTQFLKEKLKDKFYLLYDKKGKWKLNDKLLVNILNWDGFVKGLVEVDEWRLENNQMVLYKHQFVEFNNNDRIYVNFKDNKYEFLSLK